jgi:hypothetical protein
MEIDSSLTTIRAALASDATPEARAAGATACRTILLALDAAGPPPAAPPALNPAAIASALTALRGVSPDQLLDLAIAKLRAALPVGGDAPAASAIRFRMIPVPHLNAAKATS